MFQGHKRPVATPNDEQFIASGRFQINGTSDPDNLEGEFFLSVTRNTTGVFYLTTKDTIARVHSISVQIGANADHTALVSDPTVIEVGGTKIIAIHTKTAGSDADPADNTYVGVVIHGKLTQRTR